MSGDHPGTTPERSPEDHRGDHAGETGSDLRGPLRGPPGTSQPPKWSPPALCRGGDQGTKCKDSRYLICLTRAEAVHLLHLLGQVQHLHRPDLELIGKLRLLVAKTEFPPDA